ncbi:LysR substrate-binding domain-containing protein [Microbacterium sp. p3-SID338]|uniref:LysR substrate-binding domain-containing protein n=1 Tax=unclassified Microbacterium TaxID=2609290 RepID=UPI000C80A110|nr:MULTISPECIES: LysR substrate-binding domain-containing protein [unclassified Microbacterium]MCT1396369.1 LysR substrate-binding domain-containing protein [Microbacterium sp. p3-SID338]PMC02983.1 LysR family transcriptional regulator [Microbacterium sp. UMB0228]
MLDVHRLRLLVELSRRGTLSAVADALSYSKASVSQQLAALERDVGVPLLRRVGRGVQFTPQGNVLVAEAIGILDQLEHAQVAVAESLTEVTGTVRLAVFQSTAHSLLPRALAALGARHPALRVEVTERDPESGLVGVSSRDYDLILAEQYPGHTRPIHADLDRVVLAHDAIALARRPGASESADPVATLWATRAEPWVLEPAGTASRAWAEQLCRTAGFEPDVRFELADLTAHVRLIHAGLAVGLLPELVWAGDTPTVDLAPLPHEPRREIFSSARRVSADAPSIRAVRAALADAASRNLLD